MDVVCPQCGAAYELDESQISGASARVKCSSCEHVFRVHKSSEGMAPLMYTATTSSEAILADSLATQSPPTHSQAHSQAHTPTSTPAPTHSQAHSQAHTPTSTPAPTPAPAHTPSPTGPTSQFLIVRSANGVISHIPNQATLQRMIVERKLSPADELSYDGETWQALDAMPELQPFFQLLALTAPPSGHTTGNGSVLIGGQIDPASTLEFGIPSSYAPSMFPPSRSNLRQGGISLNQRTFRYNEEANESHSQSLGSHEDLPYRNERVSRPDAPSLALRGQVDSPQVTPSSPTGNHRPQANIDPNSASGVSYTTIDQGRSRSSQSLPPQANPALQQSASQSAARSGSHNAWPAGPSPESHAPSQVVLPSPSGPSVRPSGMYSSPSIDAYLIHNDDYATLRSSSGLGRWLTLIALVLGLGIGGYALLKPDTFAKVAFWLKLSDTNLKALQYVREARETAQQVTPSSFKAARALLQKAKQEVGKPFTAYLATQATVELLQVDILDLQLSLLEKKQAYWKAKLAQLRAEQAKAGHPKTAVSGTAGNSKAESIKHLADLLKTWDKQSLQWRKEFNRRWQQAKLFVGQASKRDASNPYTMIARLHLRSLSRAASSSQQDSNFQKHYTRVLDQLADRGQQGWIYLHGASVSIRNKKYTRGMDLIRNAVKFGNHPNWLYPRLLKAWIWMEKGNNKKAERILQTLEKRVAEHPRIIDFREVLSPPSLSTLLASYNQVKAAPTAVPPRPVAKRKQPTQAKVKAPAPQPRQTTPPVAAPKAASAPKSKPPLRTPSTAKAPAKAPAKARKVRKYRSRRWQRLQALAYRYCYRGKTKRGMKLAQQALRSSRNGYTYSTLGWCYLQQKRHTQALRSFFRATRYRYRRTDTYYGLGLSYLALGKRSRACSYFQRHLRVYPRHYENSEVRVMVRKNQCK